MIKGKKRLVDDFKQYFFVVQITEKKFSSLSNRFVLRLFNVSSFRPCRFWLHFSKDLFYSVTSKVRIIRSV